MLLLSQATPAACKYFCRYTAYYWYMWLTVKYNVPSTTNVKGHELCSTTGLTVYASLSA